MKLSYSIICILYLVLTSCKSEPVKNPGFSATTANIGQKRTAQQIWDHIQSELGLTTKQIKSLKRTERKFRSKEQKLIKSGKWIGAKNRSTRFNLRKKKNMEVRKLLKEKSAGYIELKKSLTQTKSKTSE